MRGFGELEQAITDAVWSDDEPLTVREALERSNDDRPQQLAYNTVQTVMEILHRKGWSARAEDGRAFRYRATKNQRGVRCFADRPGVGHRRESHGHSGPAPRRDGRRGGCRAAGRTHRTPRGGPVMRVALLLLGYAIGLAVLAPRMARAGWAARGPRPAMGAWPGRH